MTHHTTKMTQANNEEIQKVDDEILKVLPNQSQINLDPRQWELL